MFEINFTPDFVVMVVSAVLMFVFEYLPGVADWYNKQTEVNKKRIMFGLLFLTVAVVFAGGCLGWFVIAVTCDALGAVAALTLLFEAVAINQGAHRLFKKSR